MSHSVQDALEAFMVESEASFTTVTVPDVLTADKLATAQAIKAILDNEGSSSSILGTAQQGGEDAKASPLLEKQKRLCAALAEVCKDEEARAQLTTKPELLVGVHTALNNACQAAAANATTDADTSDADSNAPGPTPEAAMGTVVQCLRAIGNMCFDNAAAREALRSTGGVAHLATALETIVKHAARLAASQTPELHLQQPQQQFLAGPGSILNAAGDSQELQKELVEAGVVGNLMWLLANAPTQQEKDMALNALLRLISIDQALEQLASPDHLATLVARLEACDSAEDADDLGELLKKVSGVDKNLPAFAKDPSVVRRLVALAETGAAAEAVPIVRARVVAAGIIAVLLSDDACLAILWADDQRDALLTMLRSWIQPALATAQQQEEEQQEGGKDQKEQREEQGGLPAGLSPAAALNDPATRQVVDKAVAGLVGIGNICRSDANAQALGEAEGLIACAASLASHPLGFVQHAALGALNNLIKLKENRPCAVEAGAFDALVKVLYDPQPPLQYLACSCLRILSSTEGPGFHGRVAREEDLRQRILHLTRSEEMAVRGESMRLLVTVVKTAKAAELIAPIVTKGGMEVFVRMLQEEHPLFKCEGMIGLAVSSAAGEECVALLLADHMQPLTVALEQVEKTEMVELGLNFLALCAQILQSHPEIATSDVVKRTQAFARTRLSMVPEPAVQAQLRQFHEAVDKEQGSA